MRRKCDPVFRDKFLPDLVLALFSQHLAQPQPDWPNQTLQPGFIYYDRHEAEIHVLPELAAFLALGTPPIVFTMGSTAVHNPGSFYEVSIEVAKRLGRRAVLLGISEACATTSSEVIALPYAPYSQVFPYAAVIVHQVAPELPARHYGQGDLCSLFLTGGISLTTEYEYSGWV